MLSFFKDSEIIHSIPLNKVSYKPSVDVAGGSFTNVKIGDVTIQYFDGTIANSYSKFSNLIEESMQYYEGKRFLNNFYASSEKSKKLSFYSEFHECKKYKK
jgi:hypothetical protein